MKTARQILIEHDCLQEPSRIISTNEDRFIYAMKEYAKQVAKQALKDASENVKLGDTISNISKQILQTEIKLP